MKALLLWLAALWIACGIGSLLLSRVQVLQTRPLERSVYGTAIGLGVAAYGVLFLGLSGLLSFWPVTVWWLVLAGVGFGSMLRNARDGLAAVRAWKPGIPRSLPSLAAAFCVVVVCLSASLCLLACYRPSMGREWDAIAYHLADPKVFLMESRIRSLPTEHHSNFPFTVEMLFTAGLLYEGTALANLSHLAMALLTVGAMVTYSARLSAPSAGWIASALFMTTPIVVWEASTAYIDIGFGLYSLLAGLAVISAGHAGSSERRQWICLAGVMMGFALGTKYLALLPLVLYGGLLLFRRVPLKEAAVYAGIALVIGSPWYIKNVVLTGNPVYPFFYRLFPQSRYWSADRAATYQAEQDHFGYLHSLKQPVASARNLIQTPWRLLADADRYANAGDYTFSVLYGGLYTGFCFSLAFFRRLPRAVSEVLLLGVLQLIAWFFVAQIGRYIVSMLPFFGLASGYAAYRLLDCREWAVPPLARAGVRTLVAALLIGQTALFLWSVTLLPTNQREAEARGLLPTALSATEAVNYVLSGEKTEEALLTGLDIYKATDWINTNTDRSDGVLLLEETRGFYLDRPYLWGNGEHSAYIPYETMRDGAALNAWLAQQGIRYALINLKFCPLRELDPQLRDGVFGREQEAFQRWYATPSSAPGTWRYVLADAIREGNWTIQYGERGILVVKVGGGSQSGARAAEDTSDPSGAETQNIAPARTRWEPSR